MRGGAIRRLGLSVVAGAVLAGAAAAQELSGEWTTARGNAARTASIDERTVTHLSSHTGLAWAVPLGANVTDGAVIAGTRVVVADVEGTVHALDLLTGCRLWRTALARPVIGSPTVVDAAVFVAARDGLVVALNSADGTERWRAHLSDGAIEQAPLALGTVLVVATRTGAVVALDQAEGAVRWRTTVGAPCFGELAGTGGVVVAVAVDGTARAFEAGDGALRWQQQIGSGPCYAGPALHDGRAYTVAGDGTVGAWDLRDGARTFQIRLKERVTGALAVRAGRCYVVSESGNCRALDARSGAELWQHANELREGQFRAGVVACHDWIALAATDGSIRFWGAHEAWRTRPAVSPAVGGGPRPLLAGPALHPGGWVGVRADGLVFAQRDAAADPRISEALLGLPASLDPVEATLAARRLAGPGSDAIGATLCRSGVVGYAALKAAVAEGRADVAAAALPWREHLEYLVTWLRQLQGRLDREPNETAAQWRMRRRRLWRGFLDHPRPDIAGAAAKRWRADGGVGLDDFDPLWPVAKRRRLLADLPE